MAKRPSPPKIRGLRQQRRQKPAAQDATLINIRALKKRVALLESNITELNDRITDVWVQVAKLRTESGQPQAPEPPAPPGPSVGTMPQDEDPWDYSGLPSYPTITDKVGD